MKELAEGTAKLVAGGMIGGGHDQHGIPLLAINNPQQCANEVMGGGGLAGAVGSIFSGPIGGVAMLIGGAVVIENSNSCQTAPVVGPPVNACGDMTYNPNSYCSTYPPRGDGQYVYGPGQGSPMPGP
jgi:hypothetical protein